MTKAPPAAPFQPALQGFYDKIASAYDEVMATGNYHGITWMKDQLQDLKGTSPRVLDLGCGNGIAARALKELGLAPKMVGVDFSAGMVEAARAAGDYESLLQHDLAAGFPEVGAGDFDIVLMLGVSEFIPNLRTILKGIAKKVSPTGRALVAFELTRDGVKPSGSEVTDSGMRKYHYSLEDVKDLAATTGLKVLSLTTGFAYKSPTLGVEVPYIYGTFSGDDA